MIAYTSRLSLKDELPKLAGKRLRVYSLIENSAEALCISEIAARLGMKECSVCGRIDELRAAGCIADAPLKPGPCGKQVKTYVALVWRPEPPNPQQPELL